METLKNYVKAFTSAIGKTVLLRIAAMYVFVLIMIALTRNLFFGFEYSTHTMQVLVNLFYAIVGVTGAAYLPAITGPIAESFSKKRKTSSDQVKSPQKKANQSEPVRKEIPVHSNIESASESIQPITSNPPFEVNKKPINLPDPNISVEYTPEVKPKGKNILAEAAVPYIGLKEIPGKDSNSVILGWFTELGWDKYYKMTNDDEPWCSALPNVLALRLNLPKSGSPRAKSWLSVGKTISFENAKKLLQEGGEKDFGIVAVYHRGSISLDPTKGSGHVSIVESIQGDTFTTIGGNESNQVKKSTNTKHNKMFIGFRLLNIKK